MKKIRNWKLDIGNLEKEILDTLQYFFFFDYPPTLEEVHTFLKKKTSKRALAGILEKMEKKAVVIIFRHSGKSRAKSRDASRIAVYKSIDAKYISSKWLSHNDNPTRYTLPQYSKSNETMKQSSNFIKRQQISIYKLNSLRFKLYIKFLSLFPQIKLAGLSGSVAMLNANEDHDIDLFIITAKDRLWTGRFIALALAQLLGIRRKRRDVIASPSEARAWQSQNKRLLRRFTPRNDSETMKQWSNFIKDKICLNLFFDESDLTVPKFKRTEYVAHEVLQMKPLVEKVGIYLRFIDANRWVFDIFPNSSSKFKVQSSKSQFKLKNFSILNSIFNFSHLIFNFIRDRLEAILKRIQLYSIKKNTTSEIILDSQLWFHPEDFEKKIKQIHQDSSIQ